MQKLIGFKNPDLFGGQDFMGVNEKKKFMNFFITNPSACRRR